MKRFWTAVYIALFFCILLFPLLGLAVFGEAQPGANEILAFRPRLIERNGGLNTEFLSDLSDYIADRFALRQECVTAWAWLNAALLHTSVEDQVILGSDGWLYYAETVDDYMGQGLTDKQLAAAARNLALMQEYVLSQGADFAFTLAPNKNSLYPEHMPAACPAGDGSNGSRLPALLAEEGVHYVDLFSAFQAREETLYYKTDSHWTARGAALAADTLLAALGRESTFFSGSFPLPEEHAGDLYQMLYPTGKRTEADSAPALTGHTVEGDPNHGDAITIRSRSGSPGSLLCYRDSFGAALYPYLAEAFGSALFSRQADYDLTRIASQEADTVILELVERNIPWLLSHPALFPAPERSAPAGEETFSDTVLSLTAEAGEEGLAGFTRLAGTLPAAPEQPVYIRAGGTWYEATHTLSGFGDSGFSAWVPEASLAEGRAEISLGGQILYRCAIEK